MAIGDNFMWDDREGTEAVEGETQDEYFSSKNAFEILSFAFGMQPEGAAAPTPTTEGGGAPGGVGGNLPKPGMNMGLPPGAKLGGSIAPSSGGSLIGGGGVSSSGAGGAGRGKPSFGKLTINKYVDKASVKLYEYCCTGEIIPTLHMAIRESGGDPILYLQYCFRYNQVTGISWNGGEGTKRCAETFVLEFKAMGMQYVAQSATGDVNEKQAAPKDFRWSLETETGQETLTVGGEAPDEPVFLPGIVG